MDIRSALTPVLLVMMMLMASAASKKMNVLFLVSDDMRPELTSFLGKDFPSPVHPPVLHSPSLDRLARKSLVLKRAYVQQAVCSPSRTSLLTGRRPDTTHVYDLYNYFRKVGGNFTTIPQYFKENGYRSIGMGKIFHPGHASGKDDPISWSEPYYHAPNDPYWSSLDHSWIAVPRSEYMQKPLPDQQIAQKAVETLNRLASNEEEPFFLAVGFHKPHLPFVFPEEFISFYPTSNVSLPDNDYAPVDMPSIAWSDYEELRTYKDIQKLNVTGAINSTVPFSKIRELRRAYYSALSYTDSLIGAVLQELEDLGLANSTIVSFWGDHGWQLGEHGEWCKHTNFEIAVHAPMMVHIPKLTDKGMSTRKLTEFVDLFPTLVEAAGLPPLPLCPPDSRNITHCVEGSSLLPLIKDSSTLWKDRVFSQYPRPGPTMGYSMRTNKYRYTEWVGFSGPPKYVPFWDKVVGVELYDHDADPEENHNQACNPALQDVIKKLSGQLHAGWRHALPGDWY